MHGNTFEWCRDWYHPKLPGGVDPDLYAAKATSRVRRGGCWTIRASATADEPRRRRTRRPADARGQSRPGSSGQALNFQGRVGALVREHDWPRLQVKWFLVGNQEHPGTWSL